MQTTDIERYRETLTALRARLIADVDSLVESAEEEIRKPGEIPNVGTHQADRDSEGLDHEIALGKNERELLADVEHALQRIEEGRFGRCSTCGGEIARKRLDALPHAAYCRPCEERHEREEAE